MRLNVPVTAHDTPPHVEQKDSPGAPDPPLPLPLPLPPLLLPPPLVDASCGASVASAMPVEPASSATLVVVGHWATPENVSVDVRIAFAERARVTWSLDEVQLQTEVNGCAYVRVPSGSSIAGIPSVVTIPQVPSSMPTEPMLVATE
jgi:hypothetical protein